jgi:hypothetical protein
MALIESNCFFGEGSGLAEALPLPEHLSEVVQQPPEVMSLLRLVIHGCLANHGKPLAITALRLSQLSRSMEQLRKV